MPNYRNNPNYIILKSSDYQPISDLFETAKLWSKKLIEVAPESPAKVFTFESKPVKSKVS